MDKRSEFSCRLESDPELRRRYEEALDKLDKAMKPHIDAIRDSERLTAEDLATTINV